MCVYDGYNNKKKSMPPSAVYSVQRWECWEETLWKYAHRRQVLKPAREGWEDVADEMSFKGQDKFRWRERKVSDQEKGMSGVGRQVVIGQWKPTRTMGAWTKRRTLWAVNGVRNFSFILEYRRDATYETQSLICRQKATKCTTGGSKSEVPTRRPLKEISERCCHKNSEFSRNFNTCDCRSEHLWLVHATETTRRDFYSLKKRKG